MITAPPIDFAGVAGRADLRSILADRLGAPKVISGKPHWPCPFHADSNPSLYVYDNGRRWRCWPCGLTGDVLDFLTRFEGIDVVEAVNVIEPTLGTSAKPRKAQPRTRPAMPPATEKVPAWHAADWQFAVGRLIDQAEAALWADEGQAAREWLQSRGIEEGTIRRHRLGFLPAEGWTASVARPDGTVAGILHERGILIPWPAPGGEKDRRWCGANVRRLMADPFDPWPGEDKCKALRGSERGHLYPFAEILPTQGLLPALVCEGEFDALLAWQEVGHRVHIGTVGGASQTPQHSALIALAQCPWWLIALDHDQAGVEGARRWRERAPHKARRVMLPHGKDVGEFVQSGGNLRSWLTEETARLGIRL